MLISVYKPTRVGSNLSTCTFDSDIKHNILHKHITWCQVWPIFQLRDERYTRARRAQL